MSAKYKFNGVQFDPLHGRITVNNIDIQLEPKVSSLLLLLIESAGEAISKSDIIDSVWADRVITDDALRTAIRKLRDALGDDAQRPTFIKTLPQKGYMFLPKVELESEKRQGPISTKLFISSIALVCLLALVLLSNVPVSNDQDKETKITRLTAINGSEMNASIHPSADKIIFTHRANQDDYLQLYVKDLNTEAITRVTSDAANYANAHWSPSGNKLVFTRSTPQITQVMLADYMEDSGIHNVKPLSFSTGQSKYSLGWSRTGMSIYLGDAFSSGVPKSIWRYDLETESLIRVSSPGDTGLGDTFARESHDGQLLAILRNIEHQKTELLILHLATGELINVRVLPKLINSLVWSKNDETVTLSNFDGEVFQFHRETDQLVSLPIDVPYLNDVFYQCGDHCWYMRQHTGNYIDIAEQANPFIGNQTTATGYFEQSGADDFPLYGKTSGSIYFVSKQYSSHSINRFDSNGQSKILISLPIESTVQSLQLNPDESKVTGLLDGRAFWAGLNRDELNFLTTDIQVTSPPYWHNGNIRYAILENNTPVLYEYESATKEKVRIEEGLFYLHELADNRRLIIDDKRGVWLIDTQLQERRILDQLPSLVSNRFQVLGNWLYFTQHEEHLAKLYRVDLNTGNTESETLAKNRFRLNFDISKTDEKLVIVNSLLAQSDLVKVEL